LRQKGEICEWNKRSGKEMKNLPCANCGKQTVQKKAKLGSKRKKCRGGGLTGVVEKQSVGGKKKMTRVTALGNLPAFYES